MTSKVARRYAKAFYDLVGKPGDSKAATVVSELASFGALVEKNPELRLVASSTLVSVEDRKAVVETIAKKLGCSDTTMRFLQLLSESGRLSEVAAIAERMHVLVAQGQGIALLDVRTAEALSDDLRKKVESKFEKILHSKVEARYSVEPSLLGGLHVTANGRTFDGSLSGWLGSLQERLAEGES